MISAQKVTIVITALNSFPLSTSVRLFCYDTSIDFYMCSLLGQHSSIHYEGSASGKLRVVRTEIENRCGDFFAGANAPDRMKRSEVIAHLAFFSGKAIDHLGCDTGGGHRINTNILFGELQRESLGQAFDRMLGRGVDADLTHANVPGHAGSIDDCPTAVFQHDRDFVTHRIQNAPNVDVEDAAVFGLGGLIQWAYPLNAGVVKSDVEPAEFFDSEIDHRFHVAVFRDVCANESGIASEFFDLPDDFCALFFAAAG